MRASLLKLKRLIKRLFQIKEEVDMTAGRRRSRVLVKYLMGIAAVGMISLLYPLREMYGPLDIPREGEIAAQTIVAEFPFSMPKSRANLEEERRLAILSTPLSMDYDDDIVENSRTQVRRLFTKVRSLRRERPALTAQQMARRVGEEFPSLPEPWITRLAQVDSLTALQATLDSVLFEDIYYFGIVADSASLPPQYGSVIVRTKKRDLLMMRNQMVDVQGAYGRLLEALNRTPNLGDADIEVGYQIGRNFLVPNATFDAAATQASRDSALAAIVTTDARVAEGDLLVRGGTRVDAAQARALAAYAQEFRKKAASKGLLTASLPIVGRVVLVAAIVFLLYLIFYRFRPDVYWSNNRLFAVLLIIGMSLYLVNFVAVRLVSSVYLYPIAILSILLTVLYDARLGVVVTLLIAILLGVLNRFNFTITLITAIAGTVACFSAGEVRRRSEFYRIILSLSFSYVIIAFVVESLKLSPTGDVLTYCGYGLINSFATPMLSIGLLPLFESVFGFSTNITLLELADLNQPLLKRLAMEAPGTYHHSIIVGNLAESAAKAIGANPLLARVGAYYHDIGKMEIPEYFVENQLGIKSRHDALNPTMSALVLASHVKKGRKIGEEAGLPDAVISFIEEHHGTTMMTYFYNKAKEQELPVESEDEFRYPGPRPRSRETAIVMLADATEAASRTLDNPTPARIGNLIQRLINDKFMAGELTESNLTLRDLKDIQEAFVSILIGVFHHRVPYPKQEVEDTR